MGTKADYETLATLLASLFPSSDDLRNILVAQFPELAPQLPRGVASLADFIHDSVRILDRHGLVDESFFGGLAGIFPRRHNEIVAFAAAWRSGKEAPRKRVDADLAHSLPSTVTSLARRPLLKPRLICGFVTAIDKQPRSERVWTALASALPSWKIEEVDASVITTSTAARIRTDPMMIVDVSTASPGVMITLGMRIGLGKPVIALKDDKTRFPFEVALLEYVYYPANLDFSGSGPSAFTSRLNAAISRSLFAKQLFPPVDVEAFIRSMEQSPSADPSPTLEDRLSHVEQMVTLLMEERAPQAPHAPGAVRIVYPDGSEHYEMIQSLMRGGASYEWATKYASDAIGTLGVNPPPHAVYEWLRSKVQV